MNWEEYLNAIYSVLNLTVFRNERIIADINYLSHLFQLLSETSPRVSGIYKTINNRDISKVNEYPFKQLIMFIGRLWTVL